MLRNGYLRGMNGTNGMNGSNGIDGVDGVVLLDDGRGHFGPLTDLRSTADLRSGMLTTGARLLHDAGLPLAGLRVPETLAAVVASNHPGIPVNRAPAEGNGFLVLNTRMLDGCRGPWPEPRTANVDADGAIRMAVVDHADGSTLLETGVLPKDFAASVADGPTLAEAAWDVFTTAGDRIEADLDRLGADWGSPPDRPSAGPTILGDHPVRIAASATFDPGVVLDARAGAVAIGANVHVGINAAIHGPCAVLESTRVADQAMLKANTVIGPHCRVGGEIGGTVFQGFANKSHHGHLGDSWVGAWANLGAGTVNSNLLNTYGDVAMRLSPDGPRLRSGRQFLGCVIGDHAKTAIGTRIMTGTSIGTGAMIATSTPPAATVPAFTWATDAGTRSYRFDKFLDVARTVMARREIVLEEAAEARLRELHPEAGRGVGS